MSSEIDLDQVRKRILDMADRPEDLKDYLEKVVPFIKSPAIKDFSPGSGCPGTLLEIYGKNFAPSIKENKVTVGGKPAIVVEAKPELLRVITDLKVSAGPVEVMIGDKKVEGPFEFKVIECPDLESKDRGPPMLFRGRRMAEPGHVPPTGTLKVLFVLVTPADREPVDPSESRDRIIEIKNNVSEFYSQASYGRLNVVIDVTSKWHKLVAKFSTYVSLSSEDILITSLDQLMAEAARAAIDEGMDINSYDVLTCIINLNGAFVRGRGGWSCQNFQCTRKGAEIDITIDHEVNLIAIQETADWGRFAHELGHGIVANPRGLTSPAGSGPAAAALLAEDVYSTDLIDPSTATAQDFDMMGRHDKHPLFSGYYMKQMGWYEPENIVELQWDHTSFSKEYDVMAHGLKEKVIKGLYHLIEIRVSKGLYYYIEVRQRSDSSEQIFDENIPVDNAADQGGVVVTKALTGAVNINQHMRFITLMHKPRVLSKGEIVTDPERHLKITVLDDKVFDHPLVCRVRVEWEDKPLDDSKGAFDLRIDPWNENWESPDIWIDRMPFGKYDEPLDDQGRPRGNGDKPRPLEVNHIWARVHCDGKIECKDVRVTFYSVEPPNIGDNGNWAPIQTSIVPSIPANGFTDTYINWVPAVNRPTAIKVWIEPQPGEISSGNNFAQENVLKFEVPAYSTPKPLVVPVSICNPLESEVYAVIKITGVPDGFMVHFPCSWIRLSPHESHRCEMTVIPIWDIEDYSKSDSKARIRITGYIPRDYSMSRNGDDVTPASRFLPIGGLLAEVVPKHGTKIALDYGIEDQDHKLIIKGFIVPPMSDQKIRVDLVDPEDRIRVYETLTNEGGRFEAIFDLLRDKTIYAGRYFSPKDEPPRGICRARAYSLNSSRIAEGVSDVLCIECK